MGKSLVIKNADFSANGMPPESIEWTELTLTEGDWSGNYNTGALVNKANQWWTSEAVSISSYSYVKGYADKRSTYIYLFYTSSPTKSNATSLFVSGGEVDNGTPVSVPSTANYVIFMDGGSGSQYSGTGVEAYGGNAD